MLFGSEFEGYHRRTNIYETKTTSFDIYFQTLLIRVQIRREDIKHFYLNSYLLCTVSLLEAQLSNITRYTLPHLCLLGLMILQVEVVLLLQAIAHLFDNGFVRTRPFHVYIIMRRACPEEQPLDW